MKHLTKNKNKIVLRMCVVTRQKLPKQALIRIVLNKKKEIFVDPSQKISGKSIYIQPQVDLVKKAQKSKIFAKTLKTKIPDTIYDEIICEINNNY